MTDARGRAAALGMRLLADAIQRRTGHATVIDPPVPVAGLDAWVAHGTLGDQRLTAGLAMIVPLDTGTAWSGTRTALEDRIGGALSGGYVLWAPAGADLPAREPGRSDLITRVEEAAGRFVPGGHGEVRFPVSLYLKKSDEEGSYLTARGGLASLWARFTGRVFGHYQLDSTELHRLPAGEGYATTLIDSIALTANALKLGDTIAIEAEDAWTMQRLSGGEGLLIVGEPPGAEFGAGAPLRRHLRRTMQALRPAMIGEPADVRVVGVLGPYPSAKDQPPLTALRGMDPALYGGLDMVMFFADGDVESFDITRSPLLAERQLPV